MECRAIKYSRQNNNLKNSLRKVLALGTVFRLINLKSIPFLVVLFLMNTGISQLTQTVRGTVYDEASKMPLPGVIVKVVDSTQMIAATTDVEGDFKLGDVPVGRVVITFSLLSYQAKTLSNIDVIAGKEIVLEVAMTEEVYQHDEVVVKGKKKGEVQNEMTSVSARTFSIEASQRYAGSVNDVARMAQNFAGVQGNDDSRNDIVVRGNSPIGVLYRYEGVDIPNPNHFALLGTAGGTVSILNNNVMTNSDFITGAFPAEYGNATAAVFDLKMRNGNNQQHEFLGQVGFNGAEFMAEGPLKKGAKSSYLVSYRYSTLELFALAGINFGTGAAVPAYQDVNFKLNFHHKNGSTALFGIGGMSDIEFKAMESDGSNNLFTEDHEDFIFKSGIGVVGIKNVFRINDKAYLKTTISTSATDNEIARDSILPEINQPWASYRNNSLEGRNNINTQLNYKVNAKNLIRGGVVIDRLFFNLSDSIRNPLTDNWFTITDFKGDAFITQPFVQWQYKLNKELTFNTGFHSQHFSLNNTFSWEPRLGVSYTVNNKHKFGFGYGLHSQVPPTRVYFRQTESPEGGTHNPNHDLGMTKSHHLVLSHQYQLTEFMQLKSEVYYQQLYNVPVDVNSNSYSLLNYGANFDLEFPNSLVNDGIGQNYGVEFTLEHFMTKGFYLLNTISLYKSLYRGSNNEEFQTAFSSNYAVNVLGGKEFTLSKTENVIHSLIIDGRITVSGGQRYTPVDLTATEQTNQVVRDFSRTNELQYPAYFRIDLRVAYKVSSKKITQDFAIDFRNLTNHKNIFTKEFNLETMDYHTTYQIGFLPVMQWRIYF